MPQILLAACLRFAEQVDRYNTGQEVILALDAAVRPTMRAFGVWPVPVHTQRGDREPYPTHVHPDVLPFMQDFWPRFKINGPSILARYAWQHHRDFSLRDVVRLQKHKPSDLWIFQLLRHHHIGDIKYVAIFRWWYGIFWSPKASICLTKLEWRALRLAAEAAAQRIEEIEGPEDMDPKLTERERAVLRFLREDCTEVQIARMLKITPASVKAYVKRAKHKLGTKTLRDTVAEAVRRYVVLGWVGASIGAHMWAIYDMYWWE
jgi:DNA-binding CsgD family transcriptional regulator